MGFILAIKTLWGKKKKPLEGFRPGETLFRSTVPCDQSEGWEHVQGQAGNPRLSIFQSLFPNPFPCCSIRCGVSRSLLQQQQGSPAQWQGRSKGPQATGNLPGLSPLSYTEVRSTLINGSRYPAWSSACWGVWGKPRASFFKNYVQVGNSQLSQ